MTATASGQPPQVFGDRMLVPGGGGVMSIATWRTPAGASAFATAGTDGTIRRWDALTGMPIGEPAIGHRGNVWTVTAWEMPDGEPALASAGVDGTIRRWHAVSGAPIGAPLTEHCEDVRALAVWRTPGGRTALASVGVDGTIRRWDALSGEFLGAPLAGHEGSGRSIVAWTQPDGRPALASAGSDGTVRCWDPVAGTAIGTPLTGHDGRVRAVVAWTQPDGRPALASAGSDGTVRCWDPVAGTAIGTPLTGHDGTVQVLTVWPLPDSRPALASGGVDGTVRRWDPRSGTAIGEPIQADKGSIWAIAACPMPRGTMVISSGDSELRRWDALTGRPVGQSMPGHTVELRTLITWREPDGRCGLASAGDDLTVHRWDPVSGQPIGEPLTGHTAPVRAMAAWVQPDGQPALATAGDDLTVRRWDPVSGQPIGEPLTGHTAPVRAMAAWVQPDGQPALATAGDDLTVRRWDPVSGQPIGEPLTGHTAPVRAMAAWVQPDGQPALATAGDDLTVRRWDPVSGQPIGEPLTGHTAPVRAMAALGVYGQMVLATAADNGTIRRWNAATGAPVGDPILGHVDGIAAIAAWTAPGGQPTLATSGDDLAVRRWDASTGEPRGDPLTGHTGAIHALTTWDDPDGRPRLASGGRDGTIRLWDLASGAELGRIEVGAVRLWGLSDRAATVDLLDRGILARVVADQLYRPDCAADESGPTVVTVEGPWGSGKTTLLRMIQARLPLAKPPPERQPRLTVREAYRALSRPGKAGSPISSDRRTHAVVSVWFDPWMHQSGDQVWAGLTRSIIDAVNATLLADEGTRRRFWFAGNIAKIDRQVVRRALLQRSVPALLRIALLTAVTPVLISLAQLNESLTVVGYRLTAATAALVLSLGFIACGAVSWMWRYLAADATVYLPLELFEGPAVSGPLAEPGAIPLGSGGEPLRDPLFRARSGALYLYQHDTRELLEYVSSQGYELIVFIDDLDRCTSRTTAEVFEAVNLFLADPRLPARFVMGFDPVVVATHMNSVYSDLDSRWFSHGEDPGPGWAFLRKLVQLPVVVPAVGYGGVKRFVDTAVRAGLARPVPEASGQDITITPEQPELTSRLQPTAGTPDDPVRESHPGIAGSSAESRAAPASGLMSAVPLEASPEVSALIEQRLAAQPDLTIREAKRLINVWQLYAHLLDLLYPPENSRTAVARGCHLVILAEIITRWPALLRNRRAGRGLELLAAARDDNAEWDAVRADLGLQDQEHDRAMGHLRELLQGYDGSAVARLAALLL